MMVYDTLFALDEQLRSSRRWSTNGLRATTNSPGLHAARRVEWHDGQPVTSQDCIASLKRWSVRDAWAKLMSFVADLKAENANTFT